MLDKADHQCQLQRKALGWKAQSGQRGQQCLQQLQNAGGVGRHGQGHTQRRGTGQAQGAGGGQCIVAHEGMKARNQQRGDQHRNDQAARNACGLAETEPQQTAGHGAAHHDGR